MTSHHGFSHHVEFVSISIRPFSKGRVSTSHTGMVKLNITPMCPTIGVVAHTSYLDWLERFRSDASVAFALEDIA